jgi:hypothetical protein
MSRSLATVIFAEDAAHEVFLVPFVTRLASEEGASVEVRVRSAVGGHGRALSEFDLFQKTLSQRPSLVPDLVVVCIDANCKRYNQAHREIMDHATPGLRERMIIACPDPHIERWYMADSEGFALTVGATPPTRERKCGRDSYKALLRNTIRQAGHLAPLGGIEFAAELVEQMDLFRAGKSDKSLKAFTDELKSALTRLVSSRLAP